MPTSGGGFILTLGDGQIVGSVQRGAGNTVQSLTTLDGQTLHIDASGAALSDRQYRDQQLQPVEQALGLLSSAIGLTHWGDLGELGKLSTAVSLYNQIDKLVALLVAALAKYQGGELSVS